jgi:hypothetical protein
MIFLDTIGTAITGLLVGSSARWIFGFLDGGVGAATNSLTA